MTTQQPRKPSTEETASQPSDEVTVTGHAPVVGAEKAEAAPAKKFTIVMHHAFAFEDDTTYGEKVQVVPAPGVREQRAVEQAGGLLFSTYGEAQAFVEKAHSYAEKNGELAGHYAKRAIDGAWIYIPRREAVA